MLKYSKYGMTPVNTSDFANKEDKNFSFPSKMFALKF
jgi:hypothetical protein